MPVFNTIANLCYLINGRNEVLLQFKSRGFGQGKWNGPGGKAEKGESLEQAVAREVKEETGLAVKDLKKMAELEFIFKEKADWNQLVYVFVSHDFAGVIKPSDEGELKWFKIGEIPYDKMWEDDAHWLPKVLAGEFVKMRFCLGQNGQLENYEKI